MIRFINLTPHYDDARPRCAFFDTKTGVFMAHYGGHVFEDWESFDEVWGAERRERCRALVPDGFFERGGE